MAEQGTVDEAVEPHVLRLQEAVNSHERCWRRGPSQVLPHLYIGSFDDASNFKSLEQLGITHVFNCAEGYTNTGQKFYGPKYHYYGIRAEDDMSYNIMQHFDEAHKFIEEARTSGGRALIHCLMGINRSGTLAVAHVMVHKNIGPISAAKEVSKKRYPLMTNEQFQRQLIQWSAQRKLLQLDAQK